MLATSAQNTYCWPLLDETDSLAATILRNLGVTLEQVRDEVNKLIKENDTDE